MDVDVVDGLRHLPGGRDILLQLPHPPGEIQGHLVVDKDDLRDIGAPVHPPDVLVAEGKGLLHGHPALHAEAGDHGGGHYKVVAQVCHRVVGEAPRALQLLKGALAAVLLDGVDEPSRHRAVEQELLAGLPVAGRLPVPVHLHGLPAPRILHQHTSHYTQITPQL